MSKKMMKRSLALGALMAFVITGQALAAEKVVELGSIYPSEKVNVTHTATESLTVENSVYDKYSSTITLTSGGDTSIGSVYAAKSKSDIDISSGLTTTTGAISISNSGGGGDVITIKGKNIIVDAGNNWGVSVRGGYYGFSKETAVNIGTDDTESVTIKSNDIGIISQYEHADINVYGDKLNLEVAGDGAYGIYTGNNSDCYTPTAEVNVYSNQTKITMTGEYSSAVVAFSDSTLNIHGGLEASGDNAILVRGQSTVNVNQNGEGVVKLDGDIEFNNQYGTGPHVSANNTVNVNLTTEDSYLNGKIYVSNSSISEGGKVETPENVGTGNFTGMNLSLSNGATWNVKGDSFVNTLDGENGNIVVDMTKDEEGNNKIASVDILNSNKSKGTEVSGTGAVSDYLAANGDKAVQEFADSVTYNDEAIDTTMTTVEGNIGGAFKLEVTDEGVKANQAVNTKSDAVSDAGMALKGHWRAHMNDMNKRMGELRMANGEHGVWTRMVRGESEYQGAKMQYNQYQLGYDEKLSVDKRWTVGAAVTFAEGDASYAQGSTDDKSTAFAIYGSKLNNDGTFVDLIARYAKLESDLENNVYGNGDYNTNGYSVSAEFGKRIQQGNGLWIEPQVEFTYGTVDSADVAFDGGAYKAHYDSMDSFIARAGFALGKDIKQGNVYARASYLYDFDGETETQFEGGKAISEDFGGGWWEVGVGANINLSKATYVYADIEKTFGGEVDTNWQWNLGVRYSF